MCKVNGFTHTHTEHHSSVESGHGTKLHDEEDGPYLKMVQKVNIFARRICPSNPNVNIFTRSTHKTGFQNGNVFKTSLKSDQKRHVVNIDRLIVQCIHCTMNTLQC